VTGVDPGSRLLPPPPTPKGEAAVGRSVGRPPVPPRSSEGRARSFREAQAQRRSARRERIGEIVVVGILVLAVFAIVTARPYTPSSLYEFPSPGPPIAVHLGSPTVSTISCTAGGTAHAERIPWTNSTLPVTTGDINLRVYEIWDGDIISDPGVVANATPSNLCAGGPPDSTALWYAVFSAPNGTNLLTYTSDNGWVSLTHGPWNFGIANGSAVTLVTGIPVAGTGRGLEVVGSEDGSSIKGITPL
jgi:hypothetical protein